MKLETHIIICTRDDYSKFVSGNMRLDISKEKLVTISDARELCVNDIKKIGSHEYSTEDGYYEIVDEILRENLFLNFDEYNGFITDGYNNVADWFLADYTTPSNEDIVVFGFVTVDFKWLKEMI